ncbi:MAG: hypothetical protein PHC28_02510 [Flavobacterium sp.]|uniref:hypothetical protein n=1 Tax=Flavobacterium sp. TaxID=239 RepID=UPI00262D899B|nr:hypothetical protein [Flavobacterium sp.]MDD5149339.1 hypothetical protein [Flavobacterium sp.]
MKGKSSWGIKCDLGVFNDPLEFIPTNRKGFLACKVNLEGRIYSVYITPKNLKKFENSIQYRCFRLVFENEWNEISNQNDPSIQIALIDEITDYELKHYCNNTFEQIKTKIGVEKFSFRKPYHPKAAETHLFDSAIINGKFHKIWISVNALNFINENPNVNTLQLVFSEEDNFDHNSMKFREANYTIEILLWDEMSFEEIIYEEDEKQWRAELIEEEERRCNAMLDNISGDWGGLTGEEAELGRQNCD